MHLVETHNLCNLSNLSNLKLCPFKHCSVDYFGHKPFPFDETCPKQICSTYREGPHMRSLISIEFPVPEMEPESAHVASAVSVPYLQCGDCNPAPPRQHSPIRRYSGYSATPWYVLIQLPNVIDTISKRWRSKRAFNTSPSHIFP